MFRRCAELVERHDWLDEPRFKTDEARGAHGTELSAVMDEYCAARSNEECLAAFRTAGLPCAPVLDLVSAMSQQAFHDEEMWAWTKVAQQAAEVPLAAPPILLSDTPAQIQRVPPRLGQHTREILETLGLDPQALDALGKAGIAGMEQAPRSLGLF